ncbi:MAG: hypothetical protein HC847_10045 [Hydrococcus sp. RU_2_2]|nr:hypothetical protein [Hydrococcus sp. RU_2_2]NJP19556.1 hypothetical protein [Hydrococcus sp. CRU_1_1]
MKKSTLKFPPSKPLGLVLQKAALVSPAQIQVALRDRRQYKDLRIGEILALHGWIKPQTANFFAEQWPLLIEKQWEYPIGYYLKQAALLSDVQVNAIVTEQKQIVERLRFGELTIEKQWLKPDTIDLFLMAQECRGCGLSLTEIVDRVLYFNKIDPIEQDRFLAAMMQADSLTPSELAGIKEIFKRIQAGKLLVVK